MVMPHSIVQEEEVHIEPLKVAQKLSLVPLAAGQSIVEVLHVFSVAVLGSGSEQ